MDLFMMEESCSFCIYDGAVHVVLEECCSCCIERYCTVGDMMDLFMLCWRILYCRCYGEAVHVVLEPVYAVMEEICSCYIGRYYTGGAMMELFML